MYTFGSSLDILAICDAELLQPIYFYFITLLSYSPYHPHQPTLIKFNIKILFACSNTNSNTPKIFKPRSYPIVIRPVFSETTKAITIWIRPWKPPSDFKPHPEKTSHPSDIKRKLTLNWATEDPAVPLFSPKEMVSVPATSESLLCEKKIFFSHSKILAHKKMWVSRTW